MRIPNRSSILNPSGFFRISVFLAALLSIPSLSFSGDGIEWERFRISPALSVSQSYSDNIYLSQSDETDDFITTITPELTLDFAIAQKNYLSLSYRGNFLSYADVNNFKKNHHLGSLSFNSKTAKGSHFIAGLSAQDTAIAPFSKDERSKDYMDQRAFSDILLMIGSLTEIGGGYVYNKVEFDKLEFSDDDFTRNTVDLHVLYKRSLVWPLLLQYRYIGQDNNDLGTINTDFQTHTVFTGARWRPAMKLSGALRLGYTWAIFDETGEPDGQDFSSYAIDSSLVYELSDITRFIFTAERAVQQPTRSARESGDYFIFTSTGLTISHKTWPKITTELDFLYRFKNYKAIQGSTTIRKDRFYRAGVSADYDLRNWITFSLGYRYQHNSSDILSEDYSENFITFTVSLSM
ncbi:MAG: outer membrane beta-barrel protein [Desulfobacteraceae bacterium]|nr:outer membrane beta-barrel protein [Desulfobacteraceae bacterium]